MQMRAAQAREMHNYTRNLAPQVVQRAPLSQSAQFANFSHSRDHVEFAEHSTCVCTHAVD